MNLDFNLDKNSRFNARCSAIIFNNDKSKILLFKMKQKEFYMLPGGRVKFNETSIETIKREIKEEINLDLNFKLVDVQENFIKRKGVHIMQYAFCFVAVYHDKIDLDNFKCKDNKKQTFYWINISEIEKYNIFPKSTIHIIKNKSKNITHSIEKGENYRKTSTY